MLITNSEKMAKTITVNQGGAELGRLLERNEHESRDESQPDINLETPCHRSLVGPTQHDYTNGEKHSTRRGPVEARRMVPQFLRQVKSHRLWE